LDQTAPQLRRIIMEHSMKKLLSIVALGTVLAAPAFAQQAPSARQDAQTWSSRVHPYAAEHYTRPQYEYNSNSNPDFQLGGSR
jgi:Ni/Co efflux regulator RcnB